jgi:hypothetical protein
MQPQRTVGIKDRNQRHCWLSVVRSKDAKGLMLVIDSHFGIRPSADTGKLICEQIGYEVPFWGYFNDFSSNASGH